MPTERHLKAPVKGVLKTLTDRKSAIEGSWLVTECVPEIKDLKIKILGELDAILPEDVILAFNSSSYTASEVNEKMVHQDRLVNMHYYMPPRTNPIEIMPNSQTDADIADLLYEQSAKHGLFPYQVRKESVGLIANRIRAAVKRQCLYVAAQGVAKPEEIDSLLNRVFGLKAPPFAGKDAVGLDVVRDIERHYQQDRTGLPKEVITLLDGYIEQGKLGEKSGEGFYRHPKKQSLSQDHLVALDLVRGEVKAFTTDGKLSKVLVEGLSTLPDGVQCDPEELFVYWTNMGAGGVRANDGSLQRIQVLRGGNKAATPETIIASGQTHTPKQLHLNGKDRKLYWCDREGGRIQRCNLDGSNLETLYDSAPGKLRTLGDARDWCVGITVDNERGLVYWTQKGGSKGGAGRILRFNKEIPEGSTAENRADTETLFDNLPEPIDLELDSASQMLYWTDRGDPPFGNTLNRYEVNKRHDPSAKPAGPIASLIIADHFPEAIGLS
ncbi:hypothetical protein NliqN6_3100 [Naganishia liquefaciens]|uniref:3-hydroxyacyl-CoA dehydrogenase n=1 Tax=Naganishia liquefaciens TaxID=104408 RepID=A0A8H3TT95_9TREE|nr:hypothetical protein NliqN6_3100 [Naganishia liquefaciens]